MAPSQRDWQHPGAQAVEAVADVGLGVPQQVGVVLTGHEPGQAERLGVEALLEAVVKGLGPGFLFRGKRLAVHEAWLRAR